MSSVFSAAEKWDEPWYGILSIEAKVLYDYLYDTADNAGFKPQNFHIWSAYTGLTESEIESALEELKEVVIIENDLAWLKDHLKFNHNENINAKNNAREKIRKTYVANKNHKSAFSYYSTLLDSTLPYSTEPLNKGRRSINNSNDFIPVQPNIKIHKAQKFENGEAPMKAGDVLQLVKENTFKS